MHAWLPMSDSTEVDVGGAASKRRAAGGCSEDDVFLRATRQQHRGSEADDVLA